MSNPPLDFVKVEALRKHMMLTAAQMAKVLGVSRVTYTGWVNGKPIRKSNDERVRRALRDLLRVMTDHEWPMPEVIAMTSKQRFEALQEYLPSPEPEPQKEESTQEDVPEQDGTEQPEDPAENEPAEEHDA